VFCVLSTVSLVGAFYLIIKSSGNEGRSDWEPFGSLYTGMVLVTIFAVLTIYFSNALKYRDHIYSDIEKASNMPTEKFKCFEFVYNRLKENTDAFFLYYLNSDIRERIGILDERIASAIEENLLSQCEK
jgi:hypothetical protein